MILTALALIASIGQLDGSSSEFALSPDGKNQYVQSGYADADRYFFIMDDETSSFPYVLPGPSAEFVGANYWAGPALIRQKCVLGLKDVVADGRYYLEFWLTDVDHEEAMNLMVTVNGHDYSMPVSRDSRRLVFDIEAPVLKNGSNILEFRLFNGKYIAFDCIQFKGPSRTKAVRNGRRPVLDIALAGYKISTPDGGSCQPLIMHAIAPEACSVDVSFDGETRSVALREGENKLELTYSQAGPVLPVEVAFEGKRIFREKMQTGDVPQRMTIDYVNQFMGSSGSRWMIGPGPWMPFGMVKIMPDNEDGHWKDGYEYNVDNIMGFSHIHEWTMAGLLTMPANGPLKLEPGTERNPDAGYRSRIDKRTETARVGYYSADLTDYDIKAEIGASTRASFQKYTFNRADDARVIIDLFFPGEYWWAVNGAEVRKVSDSRIEASVKSESRYTGYHGVQEYTLHFVMEFDRPLKALNAWKDKDRWHDISEISLSGDCGLWADFDLRAGESVQVRTGISLVSVKNAALNLKTEISDPCGWSLKAVEDAQRSVWQALFDRIQVNTPDLFLKEKFYSNLYRAISPRTIWNDVNGEWIDMRGQLAVAEPGRDVYGGDSLWGTQWDLIPFYNVLYPEFMSNWLYTMEESYKRGGWLPVGNPGMKYFRVMVGSPSVSMISAAYSHGIRDFDVSLLSEAVAHQQTAQMEWWQDGSQMGNESYPDYIEKGYVPLYDDSGSYDSPHYQSYVSNTMEYAYQDWCAAQFLYSTGRTSLADSLMARSSNWKNLFDSETGFIRPRHGNGEFISHFEPFHAPGFCEGSSWQYTWYVPHDVKGLISAMGEERFLKNLDWGISESSRVNFNALGDNFSDYPINHGNQTTMHAAYLFSYSSEPYRAQKWAREIMEKYYGRGERDAYPGDEDQGQMSSWYVLNSLGFFEMDGGCAEKPVFCVGSPCFESVDLHLSEKYHQGRHIRLSAPGTSRTSCYVNGLELDGVRKDNYFLTWEDFINSREIVFTMSPDHK